MDDMLNDALEMDSDEEEVDDEVDNIINQIDIGIKNK